MEHMKYEGGFVLVRRMPSDGHCLFSALVCQFYRSGCDDPNHLQKVMELRRQVALHIRNNMETFRVSLADTVNMLGHTGQDVESRIEALLKRIEESNEWGGQESIAAAANILRRRIDVYYEDGGVVAFNRSDTARGVLRIAYRAAPERNYRAERRIDRVHYDSIVQRLVQPRRERIDNDDTDPNNFTPPNTQMHNFQRTVGVNASQIINNSEVHTADTLQNSNDKDTVLFLNWNARGCCDEDKRMQMDHFFKQRHYKVITLQETRLAECSLETANYYWFNVNISNARDRVGGGTAIVVEKASLHENGFRKISDNACSLLMNIFGRKVIFISCYIRNETAIGKQEFGSIARYLISLPEQLRNNVIMAGDMNAHIGIQDLTEVDKAMIGRNLHHQQCNANGFELKSFLQGARMKNYLTFSQSSSVKITWTNGKSMSQLDHILMTHMNFMKAPRIRAFYDTTVNSDHKMIECVIRHDHEAQHTQTSQAEKYTRPPKRLRFDLERLKNDEDRLKYQQSLDRSSRNVANTTATTNEKWAAFDSAVMGAARAVLQTPGSPPTPRRQQAHKNYFLAQQKHLANRNDPALKQAAKEAEKRKRRAYEQHFEEKVDNFLKEIETDNSLAQMTKTFRFIKTHRRQRESKKRSYINIQQWEQKMTSYANPNGAPCLLPEDDGRDAGQEPTLEEVQTIIWSTRNNSAPGVDNMNNELLKYASEEALIKLTEIMKEIFRSNNVPDAWATTIQIPIPKITNAKTTDDYRCITLCPAAYKIYAKILLNRLRDQIQPLQSYQMAFQTKRSAADQIFVLRRILDERWRKGKRTIVVSIDLKQAFDRIDTSKAALILEKLGVSRALINRIVKACLNEKTSIQWFGQRTTTQNKQKGIKQGCPLSPELFILMLDYVLKKLREQWPEIRLEHGGNIELPCILCYADDILFLCRSEEEVERLLDMLIPLLSSIGLEINTDKTKVLFRDPHDVENVAPDTTQKFGKYELAVVTMLRYLGVYITSSLSRGVTTSERISKAYKAFSICARSCGNIN